MSNLYSYDLTTLVGTTVVLLILGVALLVCAAGYIVTSIANARVLKYFNHSRPWAAWIPVYSLVCLTECMTEEDGNIDAFFVKIPKKYFILWPVAVVAANLFLPYFGAYLGTLVATFFAAVVYKDLLSQESGQEEIALGIISAIFQIVWIVMAFVRFKGQRPIDVVE